MNEMVRIGDGRLAKIVHSGYADSEVWPKTLSKSMRYFVDRERFLVGGSPFGAVKIPGEDATYPHGGGPDKGERWFIYGWSGTILVAPAADEDIAAGIDGWKSAMEKGVVAMTVGEILVWESMLDRVPHEMPQQAGDCTRNRASYADITLGGMPYCVLEQERFDLRVRFEEPRQLPVETKHTLRWHGSRLVALSL